MKRGIKDMLAPQGMFEDLGLKYVGPVDGHDVAAVENALRAGPRLRRSGDRALRHPQGLRLRAGRERRGRPDAPVARASTRPPASPTATAGRTWTEVFADELVAHRRAARRRRRDHRGDVRADRARPVRRRFPDRFYDVGNRRAARRDLGGRAGDRRPAPGRCHLRDVPQPGLRPGAARRRAAPAAGHLRPRPGRAHRRRRAEPQRHVGSRHPRSRARAADRRASRRDDTADGARRGDRGRRRADRRALPEDAPGP